MSAAYLRIWLFYSLEQPCSFFLLSTQIGKIRGSQVDAPACGFAHSQEVNFKYTGFDGADELLNYWATNS